MEDAPKKKTAAYAAILQIFPLESIAAAAA